MPQNKFYVSSFDITVELTVTGTAAFYEHLRTHQFWQEFIPAFSPTKTGRVVTDWSITESDSCTYDISTKHIQTNQAHIKQAIVILESILERYRQESRRYTFHGSAIALGSRAVWLIGNLSGIGKSTMGAYAAQHGWQWLADEKFTISQGRIVGSTNSILNDKKTRSAVLGHSPTFDLNAVYDLAMLCNPIITTEEQAVQHEWSHDKKLWIYNDEISRDIRQVNGILSGFSESLQSFDTPEITNQRNKAVAQLANNVPGAFIRGHQSAVLAAIEDILAIQ